ncbi:MAG: LysE family translocator [Alphaproteobacteria bacterium]
MVSFIITCMLIELTPGPNMAYLAILSSSRGKFPGYATVAGVALGLLVVALASAFGMAAVIQAYPSLHEAIRWAGVLYLLWLAYDTWAASPYEEGGEQGIAYGKYFRRGFFVNIMNPKAAAFYVSVLPKFIDPAGDAMAQALLLVGISITIATAIHILIVLLADRLRPLMQQREHQRRLNHIFAVLLVLVAVWFAIGSGR